jgi:hypothetical protein
VQGLRIRCRSVGFLGQGEKPGSVVEVDPLERFDVAFDLGAVAAEGVDEPVRPEPGASEPDLPLEFEEAAESARQGR